MGIRAFGYVPATYPATFRNLPPRPGQQFGLKVGHPGAVADSGTKKALGHELLEDRDHRVSCDTKLERGCPGRRQSRAGLETSIEDCRTQAVVDLLIERWAGISVDVDTQRQKVQVSHDAIQWFYEIVQNWTFLLYHNARIMTSMQGPNRLPGLGSMTPAQGEPTS